MVAQGEFLEWAEFAGNLYGTPRQPLLSRIAQGERIILEIELEGARQVRKTAPDALQIFIAPPSIEELEARIRKRGQDTEEAIARRLERAQVEIASAHEFDVQIMNDNFDAAVTMLEAVLFPPSLDSPSSPALTAKASC
jgi:guanylate kinase